MLKEAHDKLVEIRQVHSYARLCLEQKRITHEQYRRVRHSLEEGWTMSAQQELVKALAQNEFKHEVEAA